MRSRCPGVYCKRHNHVVSTRRTFLKRPRGPCGSVCFGQTPILRRPWAITLSAQWVTERDRATGAIVVMVDGARAKCGLCHSRGCLQIAAR